MRRGKKERGAALVVVLMLLAVMSILVAEFAYAVRIQAALLQNYEGRVRGRAAAQAGQQAAAGIVRRVQADEPGVFNNPGMGIMLFRYKCLTQGDPTMFLAMAGGASLDDFQQSSAAQNLNSPAPAAGDTAAMEGCGLWSLGLPYQLGDAELDIDIADEQARLNLNAMIASQAAPNPGGGVQDITFSLNQQYFCTIFELIRYQVFMKKLEIPEVEILEMTTAILDYLDYGKVDGGFDSDKITTFEIGDRIIPMKDGPLDTVDEIRLVPGMTDELYDAIKDYFTVYPTVFDPANPSLAGSFNPKINLNAASLEVVYALIRGTSATDNRCQMSINEEQAMKMANQLVQSNYPGTGTASGAGAAAAAAATGYTYTRNVSYVTDPVRQLQMPPNHAVRFYRVTVTATTPEGLKTTITRVIKKDQSGQVVPLYYRED